MQSLFRTLRVLILLGSILPPSCTPAATPIQEPTQTRAPLKITPVESAYAQGNPTAAPLDEIIEIHQVAFETPDGATIAGELYGSGKTAVVFSVMGNCKPGWREFAQLTAAQGFMAFTYPWRDCGPSGPLNERQMSQNFLNDTRGAIDFVRDQGAEEIILVGASLGGLASARLAIESGASGLIVFASPEEVPQWDFKIEPADLDTDIPKLFLTAENDRVVPLADSRALYDLAAGPKEWQTYPGTAHGTDLFEAENGEAVQQRILEFILAAGAEK